MTSDNVTGPELPDLPSMQDIRDQVRFETREGRIWLSEERTILMRSSEMRALRHELLDTLGVERAKGLLTRMGYVAGMRDAETARKLRPDMTLFETFLVGAQTHMVTGQTKVIPITVDIDEDTRGFHGVFEWDNSFEAEVYVAEYGMASDPVCWAQTGYAAGYSTQFLGRQVLFKEHKCQACGEAKCMLEGRPAEEWPDAEDLQRYLDPDRIADQLIELQSQVSSLRDSLVELPGFDHLVGRSDGFVRVREMIARAAGTDVAVMLLGETGVGKDMFAKALHRASERRDRPFIAVNCAAIPKDLIEAELFGVEKGAYTGADRSREGRFERADGGTLFLDEVGQLSMAAQAALLRTLQDQELERVGGTETLKVDVRVVAATNEDLKTAIDEGRFRADLYYRLNVYVVNVPSLRERRDDIPYLAEHFIAKLAGVDGETVSGISDKAMAALLAHSWPGNIRELANVIERGVILAGSGGMIEEAHLFPNLQDEGQGTSNADKGQTDIDVLAGCLLDAEVPLDEFEKAVLSCAMDMAGGTVSQAARLVGISRATMDYRLKKTGLRDH